MELYQFEKQKRRICFLRIIGAIVFIIVFLVVISLIICRMSLGELRKEVNQDHNSLVFVQVVFRHGERTPDLRSTYPNDPYKNETYEPYGPGALTLYGKKTLYKLGEFLREYYGEYLRDYHRDIVYGQSSPSPRCLDSMLLVLAALFPPEKGLELEDGLNWQPISYRYNSLETDHTFLYFLNCKKFVNLKEEMGGRIIHDVKPLNELVEYLEVHTGANISSIHDIFKLYDRLFVQQNLGYKLPEWTDKIFPEPLKTYRMMDLTLPATSFILRKLSGGFLLKETIDNILLKVNNSTVMERRKIHLYSGHDYNIANLLGTLGFNLENSPTYGSFLSMELHKVNGSYSVKVLYQDYSYAIPQVVKLPGCEEMCPLSRFLELYEKYKATPEECDS